MPFAVEKQQKLVEKSLEHEAEVDAEIHVEEKRKLQNERTRFRQRRSFWTNIRIKQAIR